VQLTGALLELRRSFEFTVRVIGATVQMPGLDVECVPWSAAREVEDLRPLDIGLMPLPDDEWSKGKCGMKALQYMGLAIPPVVTPVGVNAAIVTDGVTGFHARNEREWVDRLGHLLSDARLRARLGTAARRRVEEAYSARVHAPRIARIIRDLAGTH
jgi:glycosyltransferase involved in cell wall biosynthesis